MITKTTYPEYFDNTLNVFNKEYLSNKQTFTLCDLFEVIHDTRFILIGATLNNITDNIKYKYDNSNFATARVHNKKYDKLSK